MSDLKKEHIVIAVLVTAVGFLSYKLWTQQATDSGRPRRKSEPITYVPKTSTPATTLPPSASASTLPKSTSQATLAAPNIQALSSAHPEETGLGGKLMPGYEFQYSLIRNN